MYQEQQIIEKFREIKRKQYIATVPMIAIVFLLIFATEDPSFELFGLSNEMLIMIGIVGIVISIIFSVVNWRCPSCRTYISREFNPKFCKSCGVKLQN